MEGCGMNPVNYPPRCWRALKDSTKQPIKGRTERGCIDCATLMTKELTNGPQGRVARLVVLLAGIALCQFVLYGPSLVGKRILLPLDILAQAGVYLPQTEEVARVEPQNLFASDLIYELEPMRRFVVSEGRAG